MRRAARHQRPARGSGRRVLYTPGRLEIVDLLAQRDLLPAIVFIFSRHQCDEAARSCLAAGVRLTTGDEQARIRAIVEARLEGLHDDDLEVLGYEQFLAQLEAGIAAHHAGMVPAFKEAVEACFVEGLTKVVFATETLAVGINMPARTVVIEKLTKFTGDHHEALTAGEYTQLTGRAGRRGIDSIGQAVVLWSPFVPFEQVAALAASRTFHLRSAFRPTYNMAANLVGTYTNEQAHHLLNLSFAQYQADRDVVRLEARVRARPRAAGRGTTGGREPVRRHLGRTAGPWTRCGHGAAAATTSSPSGSPASAPARSSTPRRAAIAGPVAVIASAHRKGGMRLTTITKRADLLLLTADDFDDVPRPVGTVRLPTVFNPNRADYRREVARALGNAKLRGAEHRRRRRRDDGDGTHPVESDPELAHAHARGGPDGAPGARAGPARRAGRGAQPVVGPRVRSRARCPAATLLRGCRELGADRAWPRALAGLPRVGPPRRRVPARWSARWARCAGSWAGCCRRSSTSTAAPSRRHAPWFPSADVRRRWAGIQAASEDLAADERSVGLAEHRPPDPGFLAAAHAWIAGEELADVVGPEELTGGDFVRTMKQLIDLARQVAMVAPDAETRQRAGEAAERAFRGVVADAVIAPVEA